MLSTLAPGNVEMKKTPLFKIATNATIPFVINEKTAGTTINGIEKMAAYKTTVTNGTTKMLVNKK